MSVCVLCVYCECTVKNWNKGCELFRTSVCRQNLVWGSETFIRVTHIHEWIMTKRSEEENVWISFSWPPPARVEFYSSAYIILFECFSHFWCNFDGFAYDQMQINLGAHIQIVGCWRTYVLACWTQINLREEITKKYFPNSSEYLLWNVLPFSDW